MQPADDVPEQEFVDAIDPMVGDMGQEVKQICLRIDTVELVA